MKNIFFAKFESNQRSCEVYGLWQYDYGQILRIQGLRLPTAVEIHFSLTEKGGTSVTRVGTTKDGVTDVVIPDSLLENDDASQDYWIYAYIYLTDETSGSTEYKIAMKVKSRPRPEAIDRPEDQELFREAIAAVNEAADRAENAVNNLNADVSEKVTRPDTAEVGQALVVKEIDEEGKPTVFEAEDIKVPTKTSELENDSGYLTEPYDDTELKSVIASKITAPANPEVGKVFQIKTVNEDGTFIGEWADGGVANLDVRIGGESIVKDGVAEIPIASRGKPWVVGIPGEAYGLGKDNTNNIRLFGLTNMEVDKRFYAKPLTGDVLDYAVKAAMCDGKGAAWTAEEQAAARERMGIDEYEDVLDVKLEEDSSFSVDFEHEYKQLYIYIDQSGVMEKIYAVIYLYPYSYVDGEGKKINTFGSYFPTTSNTFPNVASVWKSYGKVVTRIASVTNDQKNSTGNQLACLKVWDASMLNVNGIGKPFKGIYPSTTIFKSGTRIVIKGVRA